MAKTESTAVNELINLVQNNRAPSEPAGVDLFSVPKSTKVNPPRITTTVPALRGAGEVAPLPRGRAPNGTSSMPVRMTTAEIARGNTIPPLPQASPPLRPSDSVTLPQQRISAPLPTQRASQPPPPRPSQPPPHPHALRPSQPPPPRPSRPSQPPPPLRPTLRGPIIARPAVPSVRTDLPASAPVAAPFETPSANPLVAEPIVPQQYPIVNKTPSVDMTGDMVKSDPWFEVSVPHPRVAHPDETWVGTAPVVKVPRRDTVAVIIRKLIAPTIVLAIVGVMVGGYFAFNGEGGKKKSTPTTTKAVAAKVDAPKHVEVPAVVPPPADDSHSMLPATASALTHDAPKPAAAPTPTPTPTPTPAPTAAKVATTAPGAVEEIKTSRGVVKFVEVRIDSKPAGATVMLVDNGKTSFLGSTPIATSLDPSRSYDVIFTLSGRPTQMGHIDPTKSSKLEVTLGKAVAQAEHHHHHASVDEAPRAEVKAAAVEKKVEAPKPAPVAEPAKKVEAVAKAAPAAPASDDENPLAKGAAPKKAEPVKIAKAAPATDDENPLAKGAPKKAEPVKKVEAPAAKAEPAKKVEAPAAKAEPAKAGGMGTLMVSSKPPCEILIDGKSTGLTTPQRAIPVPSGTHKVTFVNDAESIKKTVSVSISADQPTKLIQDLMKK